MGAVVRGGHLPGRAKPKAYTARVLGRNDLLAMVTRTRYKVRRSEHARDDEDGERQEEEPDGADGAAPRRPEDGGGGGDEAGAGMGRGALRPRGGEAQRNAGVGRSPQRWRARNKVEPNLGGGGGGGGEKKAGAP